MEGDGTQAAEMKADVTTPPRSSASLVQQQELFKALFNVSSCLPGRGVKCPISHLGLDLCERQTGPLGTSVAVADPRRDLSVCCSGTCPGSILAAGSTHRRSAVGTIECP